LIEENKNDQKKLALTSISKDEVVVMGRDRKFIFRFSNSPDSRTFQELFIQAIMRELAS
jgi:hypothetical protein